MEVQANNIVYIPSIEPGGRIMPVCFRLHQKNLALVYDDRITIADSWYCGIPLEEVDKFVYIKVFKNNFIEKLNE